MGPRPELKSSRDLSTPHAYAGAMGMDELPEQYRLSWLLGELVRNDTSAEHEARVLWNTLRAAGLGSGEICPRDFGRLLPELRRMVSVESVPNEFSNIATSVIDEVRPAHKLRAVLVHDLLHHGDWTRGRVLSAFNRHPPQTLESIEQCAALLSRAIARFRGLWITAPQWVGGEIEDFTETTDMQSWTRVAMGHIADIPGIMQGTPGDTPEPPGGWKSSNPDAPGSGFD